jgi:hypothetical protein
MPGEALASVGEFGHGLPGRRSVGAVVAVRPTESDAEVDIHVTGDTAWRRLAGRGARVDVGCAFTGMAGIGPFGGRIERIDISKPAPSRPVAGARTVMSGRLRRQRASGARSLHLGLSGP